jgi:hypothetical protein
MRRQLLSIVWVLSMVMFSGCAGIGSTGLHDESTCVDWLRASETERHSYISSTYPNLESKLVYGATGLVTTTCRYSEDAEHPGPDAKSPLYPTVKQAVGVELQQLGP